MLTEDARPKAWGEVVGQDEAIAKVDLLRPRGLAGRAYWIAGASGTGKTTIARLLAGDIADPFNTEEVDAGDLTGAKVADLERVSAMFGMPLAGSTRVGRAYIINEAHGMRKDGLRALLVTLERIPAHVAYIFTTTADGQESLFAESCDAAPLVSRCVRLNLARQALAEPFAARLLAVAKAEGLAGSADSAAALRLIRAHKNNLRGALQAVEAGHFLGL